MTRPQVRPEGNGVPIMQQAAPSSYPRDNNAFHDIVTTEPDAHADVTSTAIAEHAVRL